MTVFLVFYYYAGESASNLVGVYLTKKRAYEAKEYHESITNGSPNYFIQEETVIGHDEDV